MGDKKAKDLPQQGRKLSGSGAHTHKPADDGRGEGLGTRDADVGQVRRGKNTQGTGI